MFLIENVETGRYVAVPGWRSSYTTSVRRARKFRTRCDAERDLCPENERVVACAELGFRVVGCLPEV